MSRDPIGSNKHIKYINSLSLALRLEHAFFVRANISDRGMFPESESDEEGGRMDLRKSLTLILDIGS